MEYSISMLRNLLGSLIAIMLITNGCVAAPAIRETVMENEQVLDEFGKVILRWTILNETSEIEMELEVNCTGWLGIGILPASWGYPGAVGDVLIGGYNDILNAGYIEDRWLDMSGVVLPGGGEFDEHVDLILKSASYQEPWSTIRFLRSLNTGDSQDVPIIPGPMQVYYAYSGYDNTGVPHAPSTPGYNYVTFIKP